MRFAFTDEQLLLRDSVRDSHAKMCPPQRVRAAWDAADGSLWPELAELGLLGLTASEARGGLGLDELDLMPLLQQTGAVALPAPIVEHTAVAIPLLESLGGARADEWVPRAALGEVVLAVGRSGDRIPSAADVDLFILCHEETLHAVPREAVTLEAERSVDRSRRLCRVDWSPTSGTQLLEGSEASRLWGKAFDRAALGTAAQLLGLGRWMLATTVEYATVRHQFGRPIGSFQAVSHKLVDALVALEFAEPLVMRAAASMAADGARSSTETSMAKAAASDAALLTARAALQVHGAIGYAVEHDLHLWMKRVWALAAAWGDARYHRTAVGRGLLDGSGEMTAKR